MRRPNWICSTIPRYPTTDIPPESPTENSAEFAAVRSAQSFTVTDSILLSLNYYSRPLPCSIPLGTEECGLGLAYWVIRDMHTAYIATPSIGQMRDEKGGEDCWWRPKELIRNLVDPGLYGMETSVDNVISQARSSPDYFLTIIFLWYPIRYLRVQSAFVSLSCWKPEAEQLVLPIPQVTHKCGT